MNNPYHYLSFGFNVNQPKIFGDMDFSSYLYTVNQ